MDVVSTLPFPDFDYNKLDTFFFSVQKCFGLPAGLGVWVVNQKCVAKAKELDEKGNLSGPHHSISSLIGQEKNNQTPATPNTLEIFMLGKVCEAMNKKSVEVVRSETEEKSALLADFISNSKNFDFAVKNEAHRSKTVIVATTFKAPNVINDYLSPFNMEIGGGYGNEKTTQVRIANFPATSVEQMKSLIELLKDEDAY